MFFVIFWTALVRYTWLSNSSRFFFPTISTFGCFWSQWPTSLAVASGCPTMRCGRLPSRSDVNILVSWDDDIPIYYGKIKVMFQTTNQWKIDHGCHGFLWSLGLFGGEHCRGLEERPHQRWREAASETISNENGEIANKNIQKRDLKAWVKLKREHDGIRATKLLSTSLRC